MTMQNALLRFEPLDSLFFRDGRPYTKGESEQVGVISQFPPSPATLVGAIRAAAARSLGWSGKDAWDDDIKRMLGDREALGALRFRGPILMQGDDVLFPAPANLMLMRDESGEHTALLQPGPKHDCDLGNAVRLPALPPNTQGEGWKQAGTVWLKRPGFEATLRGEPPEANTILERTQLWSFEARVGIQRNAETRATEEGALYSPQHVRLKSGISLGLWAEGLAPSVLKQIAQAPQPIGGESRCAWITVTDKVYTWPALPEPLGHDDQSLRYTVIVLSPLPVATAPAPGQAIPGLPGALVSACLPRSLMLGGWDSTRQRPLALQPHLAPGSILFMCANGADGAVIRALHGACIGLRPDWGHGLISIGIWS